MADYPINKGIGHSVEFKGLKAQYLFIFAGGLLAVFFLAASLCVSVPVLREMRRDAVTAQPPR